MKRVEIAFVAAVLVFAVAFSAVSVSRARKADAGEADAGGASVGAAGKMREVDVGKMRRLIRQGYLSDHEADFSQELVSPHERPARPSAEDRDGDRTDSAPRLKRP